ncbi:hypothetical protein [Aquihabitans sp. McL0605]|uniref:hypothetical protein n=1 Tax=Aquihabitans sp. McL0605 TaxID=3415671 RepID=UPI003CF3B7B3
MTFPRPSTRAVAATLLAAALGVLAPACSSGSSDAKPTDTKVSLGGAAEVDKSTTTSAAPTTTVAPVPTGLPDQEAAAKKLYDAWFANDKVTAATVADPMAVDAMWKTAKGDYSLYNHCSTGEFDTSGCLFRGNNGTIQIDLEKRNGNWVVAGAFYSDPSSGG